MNCPKTDYNPETGRLFFGVSIEYGDVIVQVLRKNDLVDLSIHQRHFINMRKGKRGYCRGLTSAPYITADLNFVKNELNSYETFEFNPVIDPHLPHLREEGKLTIAKIAEILGIEPTANQT